MNTNDHGQENAKGWLSSIEQMLTELRAAESDDGSELAAQKRIENAREAIEHSALSVSVRSGWIPAHNWDAAHADLCAPEEYEILLTTGGPALRIVGQLAEGGGPETAEMQIQDWGTPWTRYPAPEATLLAFASCFYFPGT